MSIIVVRATPPGAGAIAVLELVGSGAAAVVQGLLKRPLPGPDQAAYATLVDGEVLDEVVLTHPEPTATLTGEETIRISCHGGEAVVGRVTAALERRGVVPASRDDLLDRALQNGRIDPIQAEAHRLLPRARTELAARVLLDQAEGALSRALRDGREVLSTAPFGIALTDPRRIVIAGRPNAGKSTLFNALLGESRVIVSDVPGTTRDPVREIIAIEQVPFLLCDTAGVESGRTLDLLESLSVERTRQEIESAHLVVFLQEASCGVRPEEEQFLKQVRSPVLRVWSKGDCGDSRPGLVVSAKTGMGMGGLRSAILSTLGIVPRYEPGAPVVFTEELRGRIPRDPAPCRSVR